MDTAMLFSPGYKILSSKNMKCGIQGRLVIGRKAKRATALFLFLVHQKLLMPIGAGPWVGITGWGLANKRYNMSSYSEEVKPLFWPLSGRKG